MQRWLRTTFSCCFVLTVMLATAGCSSAPGGQNGPALIDAASAAQAQPAHTRDAALAAAQMQELLTRMQVLEEDNDRLQRQLSDQYIETRALRQAQVEAEKKAQAAASQASERPAPTVPALPVADAGTDLDQLSRGEVLDLLIAKIDQGQDPDRIKALMAAAISVASEHKQMDPALLDALDPKSRELVARFHQMLAVAYEELARDDRATLTRNEMVRKIEEVFGAQPLQINTLALCRRVDSYGVYEPFATTRFLAGQRNRVLVYVELDNFHHEPVEDGTRYEVRLEQSVELYEANGETTVWRQGPVQLVDVSRKKRRDFFVVYPIDLPARLTAGKYRLKVRVADKHGGTMHEQTLQDIRIVADEALVGRP